MARLSLSLDPPWVFGRPLGLAPTHGTATYLRLQGQGLTVGTTISSWRKEKKIS